MGHCIVFIATLIPIFVESDAATLGLSATSAFLLMSTVNNLFRAFSSMEADILAVQRFRETMNIPQVSFQLISSVPAQFMHIVYAKVNKILDLMQETAWEVEGRKPPQNWPSQGRIQFANYFARYQAMNELVLKDINLLINPGEKVVKLPWSTHC